MGKFFVPARGAEDWRALLADPKKHWKPGYSAMALAQSWQVADSFPSEVKRVFQRSGNELMANLNMLMAFPEYKVSFPPYRARPSQNDIFVLAKSGTDLVTITVEGKVSEPFDLTVAEWEFAASEGKVTRLKFLREILGLQNKHIPHIRYQLLHRAASAIILAERFNSTNAMMLVHSFNQLQPKYDEGYGDYCNFLELYGLAGAMNAITQPVKMNNINMFFGWIRGRSKYLELIES